MQGTSFHAAWQNGQDTRRTTAGEPERTFVREDSAKGVQRSRLPVITRRFNYLLAAKAKITPNTTPKNAANSTWYSPGSMKVMV